MSKETSVVSCSFCSKTSIHVKKLIAGPAGIHICNECIELCSSIVDEETVLQITKDKKVELASIPTPMEIFADLNRHVIGQDNAKKSLSIAVYNHFKRLKSLEIGKKIKKSNVLLIGPTGSGKTMLAETLAEIMSVPFAIADATTLTEAGYVGEDVENIIQKLLQKCDYDVEKAQRGVIYVDEIDKISRKSENPSTTADVGGEGVQQSLLKLIEGTIVSVPDGGDKRKKAGNTYLQVDTSQILFICGGAFAGIEKVVNQKSNSSGIGFGAKMKDPSKDKDLTQAIANIEPDDLIKFGLIPEFIGRLPVIVGLHELDIDALVQILTEPENCLVEEYGNLFDLESIKLSFDKKAIRAIAELADTRKIGARGLRSIMEDVLRDTMFEAPSEDYLETVHVTEKSVTKGDKPKFGYGKKAA